jgi:putative SOS response-associated peptidase YedK
MCGRFIRTATAEELAEEFDIETVESELQPSYNIAPSQEIAVVFKSEKITLRPMRWGLIPSWAKDESIAQNLINARAETLAQKPSFRNAFKKSRCLIPANGFFEWKKIGASKMPMFIRLKSNRLFAFAGLCEQWKNSEGKTIHSCAIITTEPNSLMQSIHNRMPAILHKKDYARWLDKAADVERLSALLAPFDAEAMRASRVSTAVNSPRNNSPECIAELQ